MTNMHPMGDEFQEFLKDESRTVGNADSISFPTSEEEVVAIVRHCHANAIPLTVQGARTGLAAGAVPTCGHALNLSRLKAITTCAQEDDGFTFTLQPGLSLIELNKFLATKKFPTTQWDDQSQQAFLAFLDAPTQFFPPDPTESTCSLGGMASCNASGARSFLYGAVRNHLVGLRVILSDGEALSLQRGHSMAKGRILTLTTESGEIRTISLPRYQMPQTKNASGYFVADDMDAVDLFIGADGTLGVITELTIRTQALPAVIWGISCFFPNQETALDFVIALRQNPQHLAAVEYFDPHALEVLRNQKANGTAFAQLPHIPQDYQGCVFCELHCASVSHAQTAMLRLGDWMEQVGGDSSHTWVARTESDLHTLQFFRHAVPESVNMIIDGRKKIEPAITKLGSDMSVPDAHLKEVFQLYTTELAQAKLEYAIWGHIGNNHLHVNILPRDLQDFRKGKALFKTWAEQITAWGGAVSAEHGVGKLKADFLEIMYQPEGIDQMRALKIALDAPQLLNQGNLFPSQGGER